MLGKTSSATFRRADGRGVFPSRDPRPGRCGRRRDKPHRWRFVRGPLMVVVDGGLVGVGDHFLERCRRCGVRRIPLRQPNTEACRE